MSEELNNNRTSKKRPAFGIGLQERNPPPEVYAKRHEIDESQADASDQLLQHQNFFRDALNDIEKKWNIDKEHELRKKIEGKIESKIKHGIMLDLQEENRKTLIGEKRKIEARLLEELRPEIEKELRGKIEEELKAAHEKELEEVKARVLEAFEERLRKFREDNPSLVV